MIDRRSPFGAVSPADPPKDTKAIPAFARAFVDTEPQARKKTPQADESNNKTLPRLQTALKPEPVKSLEIPDLQAPTLQTVDSIPSASTVEEPIPQTVSASSSYDDYNFTGSLAAMDFDDAPMSGNEYADTSAVVDNTDYDDDFNQAPAALDISIDDTGQSNDAGMEIEEDGLDLDLMAPTVPAMHHSDDAANSMPAAALPRISETEQPARPSQNTSSRPRRSLRELRKQRSNDSNADNARREQYLPTARRVVEETPVTTKPELIPVMDTLDSLSSKMSGNAPTPSPQQTPMTVPARPTARMMKSPFRPVQKESDELVEQDMIAAANNDKPRLERKRGSFGAGAYRADIGEAVHTPGKVKNYRGMRIDPLAILALWLAFTPAGFVLGIMSLVRYAQNKYEQGKHIAFIATAVSALIIMLMIVAFTLYFLKGLPGGLQGFGPHR